MAEDSDDEDAPEPTSKPTTTAEDDSDAKTEPAKKTDTKGDVSDSELSSVIDEEPKRKKRAPAAKGKKEKAPTKPKAAPKAKAEDDPDTAEVKRLQGWLVKCGIRKVWSRDPELSQCDTSKDKIRVLKGWLKDVGMDGKYSVEKAAKIKEQREFAKDLEAIKEGEAAWAKRARSQLRVDRADGRQPNLCHNRKLCSKMIVKKKAAMTMTTTITMMMTTFKPTRKTMATTTAIRAATVEVTTPNKLLWR